MSSVHFMCQLYHSSPFNMHIETLSTISQTRKVPTFALTERNYLPVRPHPKHRHHAHTITDRHDRVCPLVTPQSRIHFHKKNTPPRSTSYVGRRIRTPAPACLAASFLARSLLPHNVFQLPTRPKKCKTKGHFEVLAQRTLRFCLIRRENLR